MLNRIAMCLSITLFIAFLALMLVSTCFTDQYLRYAPKLALPLLMAVIFWGYTSDFQFLDCVDAPPPVRRRQGRAPTRPMRRAPPSSLAYGRPRKHQPGEYEVGFLSVDELEGAGHYQKLVQEFWAWQPHCRRLLREEARRHRPDASDSPMVEAQNKSCYLTSAAWRAVTILRRREKSGPTPDAAEQWFACMSACQSCSAVNKGRGNPECQIMLLGKARPGPVVGDRPGRGSNGAPS